MRLPAAFELKPVLDVAQEDVRVGEFCDVLLADIPLGPQDVETVERRADTQPLVVPSVHELEQLHGELHVADAARAELHLPLAQAATARLLLGPRLQRTDLFDRAGIEAFGPHVRLDQLEERTTDPLVTDGEPALDQ